MTTEQEKEARRQNRDRIAWAWPLCRDCATRLVCGQCGWHCMKCGTVRPHDDREIVISPSEARRYFPDRCISQDDGRQPQAESEWADRSPAVQEAM